MRAVQASRAEWSVAALGLLLLGLLFAPWYAVDLPPSVYQYGDPGGYSGWATGTVTSIVVAAFSAACLAQALVLRAVRSPAVGAAWNVGVEWSAIVTVIWIGARAMWPPDAFLKPGWGLWASLAVAIAILVANWLGMRDEREDPALVEAVPVRPIPPLAR